MESSFHAEVTIRFVRYANEESGWAVLDAAEADGRPVALVGPLVHLEERERVRVTGIWVNDSRYGPQVKVSQAHPLPPDDPEALVGYLKRVKHVGAKRAAGLIASFGSTQVLDAIDHDPAAAFSAAGLRGHRALQAAESWQAIRVTRRLHLLLAPHGLAYLAGRIHEHYGSGAHTILAANPYELTSLFGVGFAIADRIALAAGTAPGGPERERAAIMHVLTEAERSGSTCLPVGEARNQAAALLGKPPSEDAIEALVAGGALVREQQWLYRAATAELEAELAHRVEELIAASPYDKLTKSDAQSSDGLTGEQCAALTAAFVHRLSVITGGPGTGKTASIKSIAATAEARGGRVMLLAPTGRAAVRMTEASGLRARTVHSALGWIPGEGPTHDAQDPLTCDLLIVDETSMANLELLVTLLRAVGGETHVVLVGDADQLAPVGAGKPFAELVSTACVPSTRLTHIFRQAAGSMIVQGAHAIRRGTMPEFSPAEGMKRDLFLIERPSAREALAEIVSLVAQRLPSHYDVDPVRDIQVFAPVYRGELGIDAINLALRGALNPDGAPVRGGRLRLGDKLMMTGRNLHELGLMNGTLLRLLDEVSGEGSDQAALLVGSEESVFRLPPEDADRLRLAYACSVHRGQGIELPVAVIVAHPAAGAFFLRREMLYTAVTRARLATVIVGTRQVIARAVQTADTGRRHGRLGERLAGGGGAQATNDQLEN
ncbi:MAG TPA: AAA family ATPase [Solirubrobacteraceae bacterium]